MSGEIAPYDPAKLMDAVRDRIKAEFVALIPEDAWNKLVNVEVKKFFETTTSSGYYENRTLPSPFGKIVWEELEKETRVRVKALLESSEWAGEWDGQGGRKASEAVKKLITEKSGEILATVIGVAIQGAIESARQRI